MVNLCLSTDNVMLVLMNCRFVQTEIETIMKSLLQQVTFLASLLCTALNDNHEKKLGAHFTHTHSITTQTDWRKPTFVVADTHTHSTTTQTDWKKPTFVVANGSLVSEEVEAVVQPLLEVTTPVVPLLS